MGENQSSVVEIIPLCNKQTSICLPPSIEWTIIATNVFSLILNVLHMAILCQIKALRGKAYFAILQATSAADVLYALRTFSQVLCQGRMFMQRWVPAGFWSSFFNSTTTYIRLVTLGIACMDRFLAMYRPFNHRSSLFVRHIWVWLAISWVFAGVLLPFRDVFTDQNAICMDIALAANHCIARPDKATCASFMYLQTTFLTVSLTFVLIQIYRIRQRLPSYPRSTHRHKETTIAAVYVILMVFVYFLCYSLHIVDATIALVTGSTDNHIRIPGVIINSFYGILNTLIYGWITKAYQREVVKVLRSLKLKCCCLSAAMSNEIHVHVTMSSRSSNKDWCWDISASQHYI